MNPMTALRQTAAVTTAGAASFAGLALMASPALAHGSMQDPVSRVMACYKENPESPKSAACKAAVAAGGTQPFYDWNGVRDGEAAGQHRKRIPDGKLCSGGDPAFRGLDLPRADWPATKLSAGTTLRFQYRVTAQHQGGFQLYVTRDGYNPAKPLAWSDLEAKPFLTKSGPAAAGGFYTFTGKLPATKKGRHVIYAIWQRTDSPEAFYSCSDVVIGKGTGGGTAAPVKPAKPTKPAKPAKPVPAPPCPTSGAGHAGHSGGRSTTLKSSPVAETTPAGDSALGTGMIAGVGGLVMGGVAGLLLTGRRRRPARD